MALRKFVLAAAMLLVAVMANAAAYKASDFRKISSFVTAGGDQTSFKRQPQKQFSFGDRILHLTMIRWEPIDKSAGRQKLKWRWYSNDALVSELKWATPFRQTPFEIMGTIPASALGPGKHRVELYIGEELYDTQEFEVAEAVAPDAISAPAAPVDGAASTD